MPYAALNGYRVYYEVHGSGFPLLLINGLGSDHLEWLFQIPAFEPHSRVLAYDHFGTGRSDVPPGPYTTARMADDACILLESLEIRRAHVLGGSLGGMIAQEVALRHPDRVGRLVLGCTAPGGSLSVRPSGAAMAAFLEAGRGNPEAELRRMVTYLYTDAYIAERTDEIEAFIRRRLENRTDPAAFAAQLSAAMTHDAADRLHRIEAGTLVITGDADRLVPPENSARLAARIPRAKLVVLPGAPHRLFAENAEVFNQEVLEFLKS